MEDSYPFLQNISEISLTLNLYANLPLQASRLPYLNHIQYTQSIPQIPHFYQYAEWKFQQQQKHNRRLIHLQQTKAHLQKTLIVKWASEQVTY